MKLSACACGDSTRAAPDDLKEETKLLTTAADRKVFNIVHLIYRARNYEGHSKDYEF